MHSTFKEIHRVMSEVLELSMDLWVIPCQVAQEIPRPPSILTKIGAPIVPHDLSLYA